MFEQTFEMQPASDETFRAPNPSSSAERAPFVKPALTELGRMDDLTLLGGSLP